MKRLLFASLVLLAFNSHAGSTILQCSGYKFEVIDHAMSKINGETVTSQKIQNLGGDGIKVNMSIMPARDGNNYGFEYIHRPGSDTRFLNVQLIQFSQDQPKIIGSFPCKKVN